MNLFAAITTRRSVRTFNGLKLDDNIQSSLRRFSNELRATGNSNVSMTCFERVRRPEIVITEDARQTEKLGTYGVISGARNFAIMGYGNDPTEQILAGYLFEKFVIECTRQGVKTCWLGGTFSQSGFQQAYENATSARESATEHPKRVGIVSPLGHSTPKKRFAERMMRRIVRSAHRHRFEKLFAGIEPPSEQLIESLCNGTASHITLNDAVKVALEMMRLAPSSRNSQPWRASIEKTPDGNVSSVTIFCTTSNSFSNIDTGIGLYHFIATIEETGHKGDLALTFRNDKPSARWTPVPDNYIGS